MELFAVKSRIVVAQERVPDKTCERAALPHPLRVIAEVSFFDTMRKLQVVHGQKDTKSAHHKNGTSAIDVRGVILSIDAHYS
jgi:hypothetical protein